jgi:uncharacterized cupredoxin-like copper-binding protein
MVLAFLGIAALVMTGCNRQQATTVDISLTEWAVAASPSTAPAGTVTFEASNKGTEIHEFVVIKTDLGLIDLPVGDDGSVNEEGQGIEVIDEIEDLAAGEAQTLQLELSAGNYVLICNVVETEESGERESHYQMGMRTSFKVT